MIDSPPAALDSSEPAGAEVDDMAAFLELTNRIATRLQASAALSRSGVTLADWLVLHAIRGAAAGSLAEVARKVGVSRQRVHQQASDLAAAGLVTISRSEVGNSRQIALSPGGQEVLAAIGNRLQEALTSPDGSLNTQIRNARRSAARLAKWLASAGAAASAGEANPAIS